MNLKRAIAAIEKRGALLVYPIDNQKEPPSLWSEFFPKTQMRWEWDDESDHRVADLWHLRAELSDCTKVVYAKWYRGRATFFSRELFTALLALLNRPTRSRRELSENGRKIFDCLLMDSPLSPRVIKKMTELQGKLLESTYEKAIKELWSKLLIVGFGEIQDGAFPSLAVGATEVLFEDLWRASRRMNVEEASEVVKKVLGDQSLFLKPLHKLASLP